MKSLIVVYSYHHSNTEKIAKAMAESINADLKHPIDAVNENIDDYDIIGFGAGIDSGKHYKEIIDYASSLQTAKGKKAFIFSTAGISSEKKKMKDHAALREVLSSKGFEIIDEFACPGFDTNSVLKYIGGLQKGRPNEEDIKSAVAFAKKMVE